MTAALPTPIHRTTARPFLPHPRHRSRPFRSRTLAAGPNPALSRASGVSSATWWQAAQSTLRKSPAPDILDPHQGTGAHFRCLRSRICSRSARDLVTATALVATKSVTFEIGHRHNMSAMRAVTSLRVLELVLNDILLAVLSLAAGAKDGAKTGLPGRLEHLCRLRRVGCRRHGRLRGASRGGMQDHRRPLGVQRASWNISSTSGRPASVGFRALGVGRRCAAALAIALLWGRLPNLAAATHNFACVSQ